MGPLVRSRLFWIGIVTLIAGALLPLVASGYVLGLLTVAFGVRILLFPGTGLLSLIWIVGIWAIVFGITSLALAWRLRGLHQEIVRSRMVTSAR